MVQIAQLLDACSGDTTTQKVQNDLYAQLDKLGLKVKANEYGVSNPGGMRTYFAQLACLGLFWKDENKHFKTTFAGEELINANEPLKVIRCQLLRMQYPSVYGLGPNVRISDTLKVKPFVFLINLLKDPRLNGFLTCQDIAVAVIYGRTHSDHDKCVQKILKLRESGNDLIYVVDSADDVRTPRRYTENAEADLSAGIHDAADIANTGKNYLEAAQILVPDADDNKKFILNCDPDVLTDINTWLDEKIDSLDTNSQAAWQMRYGRYTKSKSIRSRSSAQINGEKALVCSNFVASVTASPFNFDLNDFIREQAKIWGKSEAEIGLLISGVRKRISNIERDTIKQAAASGGRDAIILERATTAIFKKLGFELTEHIGQKKALSSRQGGYPDIRIRSASLPDCGFGDTKATMTYGIPLGDTIKLETYYKECWQEFPDKTPASYFLYISGGYSRKAETVELTLKDCSRKYGRPVSAITVDALLELAEMDRPPKPAEIVRAFRKGTYYTTGISITNAGRS